MTLTDKWKKGELPYGYYYIKTISGGEVIDRYYRDCTDYDLCEYGNVWENRFEDEIIEVLAPVPSYDDFKRIIDDWRDVSYENKKLKELIHSLKCCLTSENIEPQIRVEKSLGKINEVLK